MEAGRFRRELFYRLSTIILTIPPLKDRGEDVLLIAEHYDRKISIDSGRDLLCLGPEVQDALMAHHWPGNVRELRNFMTGLHCLAKSRTLTLEDLPRKPPGHPCPGTLTPTLRRINGSQVPHR